MSRENRIPIDPHEIDLLVDGQLGDRQRRELLERMDWEPAAWRRCALGFLEAQCWRESLGPLAKAAQEPPPARRAPRPASRFLRWGSRLAVAASFVLAFGLGILLRPVWRPAAPDVGPPGGQLATAPQGEGTLRGRLPEASSPWRMVTLTSPNDPSDPIRLPAVERKRIDDDWLRSLPSPLPSDVLKALERTGHAVQQSRELLPVPLEDGRRLIVPVDQVEVRSMGRYQ